MKITFAGLVMKEAWVVSQTGVCLIRMRCGPEAILPESLERVMKTVITGFLLKWMYQFVGAGFIIKTRIHL